MKRSILFPFVSCSLRNAHNLTQAGPINPHPGIYNFAPADEFGEFGEEYDMLIIGHTLV